MQVNLVCSRVRKLHRCLGWRQALRRPPLQLSVHLSGVAAARLPYSSLSSETQGLRLRPAEANRQEPGLPDAAEDGLEGGPRPGLLWEGHQGARQRVRSRHWGPGWGWAACLGEAAFFGILVLSPLICSLIS